ncbi:nuclear transport factor 2 family protein [Agrococcus sp. DT81.2]|uniref:nuclear transport factor 2 family protein n=1 Tax=Agrococcus sp. DT81.2 TaxID=3393414 RepID=UPI003CE593D8
MTLDDEIRDAAQAIVRAFRENDEEAYFAGFVADCSFAFHTDPEPLLGTDAWRAAWRELQASGWRVIECRTLWDHVQAVGDGGVYLHEVETTAGTPGAIETYRERESIVFARLHGQLVAVHEHLSPIPTQDDDDAQADASDERQD